MINANDILNIRVSCIEYKDEQRIKLASGDFSGKHSKLGCNNTNMCIAIRNKYNISNEVKLSILKILFSKQTG